MKRRWNTGRRPVVWMTVALVMGACQSSGSSTVRNTGGSAGAVAERVADKGEVLRDAFTAVSHDVQPAVVNISTVQPPPSSPQMEGPLQDFFERFFGGPMPQMPRRSLGSGVIVDSEGFILTNHHVVAGADAIEVQLADETTYDAELVGSDASTDLAVIKVEPDEPLPTAPLGDSDQLAIGQWVLAMGNPFGLGGTVTAGIVSATSRVIGQGPYDDFIQTDAAINPGNSGGPLLNLDGEIIGINSAIFSRTGGNVGIGFAIPSNLARNIYTQLVETGKVTRGWIGITIQDLTLELAKGFGVEVEDGAVVSEVGDGTPASEAGLEPGDVIVALNGEPIESSDELVRLVGGMSPGADVEIEFYRDGERQSTELALGERPSMTAMQAPAPGGAEDAGGRLGASVQALNEDLASRLGTTSTRGVVITGITPGEPAAEAGLRVGDVILEAGRTRVETPQDLRDQIATIDEGGSLLLRVERTAGGNAGYFFVTVTL